MINDKMNPIHVAIHKYLQENNYNKLSLKAILFDMDGVLYDSMKTHAFSWIKAMCNNGINMTEADAYLHEGRTGYDTINLISEREGIQVDDDIIKRIYHEKTIIFASYPKPDVIQGSVEVLQKVAAAGLFAMLVTGSGQPTLIDQLNVDFSHVFARDKMVTSFDVKQGKPNPEPYLMALQKGGLHASEAIVVENAPLGIIAARAAGLFVIAVNTGPLPDSVLIDAGANLLFPSLLSFSNSLEILLEGTS